MDYAALGTAFLAWLKEAWPALHDAILVLIGKELGERLRDGDEAKAKAQGFKERLDLEADLRSLPDNELDGRVRDTQQRIRARLADRSR